MPSALITADELFYLNLPNKRTELVRGALVVREPAGGEHGSVAARVLTAMSVYVDANALGIVLAAETGFRLFTRPDTVRAPDVAFIRTDRVPRPLPVAYFTLAPDLAVEVTSPGDTRREIREKVDDWIAAGTVLVWQIDPHSRSARVYGADGSEEAIAAGGTLTGQGVVPGLELELAHLFR
ncbi:MAG TPA: Uma2 family endonuclease [Gemmatimonadaceae bacterium]|nr:Uma2 family endonuclease [Gemmatimonadaceae bacterium]